MKYITDTDFLPGYLELQSDGYRILYNPLVFLKQEKIYAAIIDMCKDYDVPILRKTKIKYWQRIVNKAITMLEKYTNWDEDVLVYIPFLNLKCTPQRIINLYEYTQEVLDNVIDADESQLIVPCNGEKRSSMYEYVPIHPLRDLIRLAVPKMSKTYRMEEQEMMHIVYIELIRRGCLVKWDDSSINSEDLYRQMLFDGKYLEQIPLTSDRLSTQNNEITSAKTDNTRMGDVGFLYYALDHYFTKLLKQKKSQYISILRDATYTIANGLFSPEIKLDKKAKARHTFYQYAQKKSFNGDYTKPDTLKSIERVLSNCLINIPNELSEAISKLPKLK